MAAVNLLWTSGWDSTFRLLQIILIEEKSVQPIYIIDRSRKSLKVEQEGIEKILNKIKAEHYEAFQQILPVRYVEEDLTINNEIAKSSKYINSFIRLGSQYSWLAQFCHNHNLKNVEICNDKNLNTNSLTYFISKNYLEVDETNPKNIESYSHAKTIFQYFNFPVIKLSKRDMLDIIKLNKWENIMYLTWFCHKPRKNKACGKCVPCINVIKKGMGFRIPFFNRLRGYFKIYIKNNFKLLTLSRAN